MDVQIIAMKGHPGTGKSTLAAALAKRLKCPLVDKDHFRDCTYKIEQTLSSETTTRTKQLPNELSYEAMFRVIAAQLSLGLSVVVDSPLSRKAVFDRLVELADRAVVGGARVFVVECRPSDVDEWRRRLEMRGGLGLGWHKPKTWKEMEDLLEAYGNCWDYDLEVPVIEVDTTARGVGVAEMVEKVADFVNSK